MKKLLYVLALILITSFSYGQEYDDMYYNKHDRKRVSVQISSTKHVNPEYIVRYKYKPRAIVQTYYSPYYDYNYWGFNYTFGYNYWWNSWYPYSYYSYWAYPYHYNYSYYYPYHNHYTIYKTNSVKYQPRTVNRSSVYVPQSTRTNRVVRTTPDTRNVYRNSTPQRTVEHSTYQRPTTQRSNSYSTPQRTTPSRSYTPAPSRAPSYAPSRSSSGSYSGGRSSSPSSSGRGSGRQ